MNAAMVPSQRVAGREHFPISVYPKRWYALRVAQLIGAIICMSLAAYAQANWTRSKAGPFTIFTSSSTLMIFVYFLVAQFGRPEAYNYWAVIALDAYLTLFWFVSFVLLISEVADIFATSSSGNYLYSGYGLAAAIVFAAFECFSFATLLGLLAYHIHQHRAAGLHSAPIITALQIEREAVQSSEVAHSPTMYPSAEFIQPPAVYQLYQPQSYMPTGLSRSPQPPYPVQYRPYRLQSYMPTGLSRSPQQPYPVQYQPYRPQSYMPAGLARSPPQQYPVRRQPSLPNVADHTYTTQYQVPAVDIFERSYPGQYQAPAADILERPYPGQYKAPTADTLERSYPGQYQAPTADILERPYHGQYQASAVDILERSYPGQYQAPVADILEHSYPGQYQGPAVDIPENTYPGQYQVAAADVLERSYPGQYQAPPADVLECSYPGQYQPPAVDIPENAYPVWYHTTRPDTITSSEPPRLPSPAHSGSPLLDLYAVIKPEAELGPAPHQLGPSEMDSLAQEPQQPKRAYNPEPIRNY